jgi:hypothetical protein
MCEPAGMLRPATQKTSQMLRPATQKTSQKPAGTQPFIKPKS